MRKRKKRNKMMLCACVAALAGFALGWMVGLLTEAGFRGTGPSALAPSQDASQTKVLEPTSSLNLGADLVVRQPEPEAESLLVLDPEIVRSTIESDDPGRTVSR